MPKESTEAKVKKLNKLQQEFFGFTVDEFLAMDDERLGPDELDALARNADTFYKEYFKRVINKLMALQQKHFVEQGSKETTDFMRGALSGQLAIKQWFESQQVIARPKNIPAEEINPTEL